MKFGGRMFQAGVGTLALAAALVAAAGCGPQRQEDHVPRDGTKDGVKAPAKPAAKAPAEAKIEAALGRLPPEDRALAEAQGYCPVMPEQRLGGMGVPLKVIIKGQPVFLCCKGCKGTALDEPDETLKAVAAMKAKSRKP